MKYSIYFLLTLLISLTVFVSSAIANQSWQEQSKQLENSIKELIEQLPENKQKQLIDIQETWRNYIDSNCNFEKNLLLRIDEEKCISDAIKTRQGRVNRYLALIQPNSHLQEATSSINLTTDDDLEIKRAQLITSHNIAFTVWPSSFLDENQKPGDFRTEFTLGLDQSAFITTRFFNLTGKHEVIVRWISPDLLTVNEIPFDYDFLQENTGIWHKIDLENDMPTGDWLIEIILDGKSLATKKISLLPY